MWNFVRSIVSGKKKRLKENGFDLDLTYITPRVLAMSIPGEGVHTLYRNSLKSVAKYLNQKHKARYQIFNLAGISYHYEKFNDSVKEFPWPDHYPPPIELLFRACRDMHIWLNLNSKNVVVVHCKAGKGRTGTLICCYLIFSGRLSDPEEALKYYKKKRFKQGGGVTHPSQVRYIHYFSEILKGNIKGSLVAQLISVQLLTAPHINGNSSRPFIEIFQKNTRLFTSKVENRVRQVSYQDSWEDNKLYDIAVIGNEFYLQGDILCKLMHWGALGPTRICRFSFNTAFIHDDGIIIFKKTDVDPDLFRRSKKVDDKFEIKLTFLRICDCKSDVDIINRCQICQHIVHEDEIELWESIKNVILERFEVDPVMQLFGDKNLDDIDKVITGDDLSD